jgi:hypothetical protein
MSMTWNIEDYRAFQELSPNKIEDLIGAEQPRHEPDSEYYDEYDIVAGDEVWEEWHNYQAKKIKGLGTVTVLETVGGGEGSGEYLHKIVRVSNAQGDHRFFQKQGCYMSYNGSTWDGDLFEVRPVQRTVTVWQEVKR